MSLVNNPEQTKSTRQCRLCRQHNVTANYSDHKMCPFEQCSCRKCDLIRLQRRIMAEQIQLRRRHNVKSTKSSIPYNNYNCQRCRNHDIEVSKKKHECPHTNCICELCALTKARACVELEIKKSCKSYKTAVKKPKVKDNMLDGKMMELMQEIFVKNSQPSGSSSEKTEMDIDQASIDQMKMDQIRMDQINMNQIRMDQASIDQMRMDKVNMNQASIDKINMDQINVDQVNMNQASIDKINMDQIRMDQLPQQSEIPTPSTTTFQPPQFTPPLNINTNSFDPQICINLPNQNNFHLLDKTFNLIQCPQIPVQSQTFQFIPSLQPMFNCNNLIDNSQQLPLNSLVNGQLFDLSKFIG